MNPDQRKQPNLCSFIPTCHESLFSNLDLKNICFSIIETFAQQNNKRNNSGAGLNNIILYGSEKTLKVTIRMNEVKERNQVPGAIFYKDDEARFNQQHTLKLKTFSKYNVTMEVEPAMEIS